MGELRAARWRLTGMRWIACLAVLLLAATACGEDPGVGFAPDATPSPEDTPTAGPAATPGGQSLLVHCNGLPFPIEALDGPTIDEDDDDPAVVAFREWLEEGNADWMPGDSVWRLLHRSDDAAEFGAALPDDGDEELFTVSIFLDGETWRSGGHSGCRPQPYREEPPGGTATWWPADPDAIGPDTRIIDVLVMERACASGQSAEGRVRGPEVHAYDEQVIVTFFVESFAGASTCPSNPPTPATLDLGEPLGDRDLRDGAFWPPREPTPDY